MTYLQKNLLIGFKSMDEKELLVLKQLEKMTSSSEFLEAVLKGDEELVKRILAACPNIIVSRDPNNKQFSAIHYAVKARNYSMLRLLKTYEHINFDLGDQNGESALFLALPVPGNPYGDLKMLQFLIEECGADVEHREDQ